MLVSAAEKMFSQPTSKLRDLIVGLRGCNTNAEERAYIQRESAVIRQSFKDGKDSERSRNMLKLIYMGMLGYSTEFAQMEVVKLITQPDFGDKRIGYLTLTVLLDETHEVLTLAENRIKKDLEDTNLFVQSIALTTVANVAGEDMSRDVMHEVMNLVTNTNTQLKKKACLAALRIVRKVPDFAEIFLEKFEADLFGERQHGALLCSLTLVNKCLSTKQGAAFLPRYRQLVNGAARLLKSLMLAMGPTHTMEHDVGGISDPFLQVALLQFLRLIGAGSPAASEMMNDILAQIGTNTDGTKTVGCAVLYEATRTIFAVCADESLRILGINILARFLTNVRDNNLRFVALAALLEVNKSNPEAVQAHRATIIDCLKDVDTSIRRRALELTIALVNPSNVRILIPDLIAYLGVCGEDLKKEVTCMVCQVVEGHSPTAEWRVETSLRIFKVAKVHIPLTFASRFVAHVSQQDQKTQSLVVANLWEELSLPFDAQMQLRQALLVAGTWCTGEFIELLVAQNGPSAQFVENVASCVFVITSGSRARVVQQYGLTALAKIVSRVPSVAPLVASIFDMYAGSLDCELQQRACEYATLTQSFGELSTFALSKMPPMELVEAGASSAAPELTASAATTTTTKSQVASPTAGGAPDLLGPAGGAATATAVAPAPPAPAKNVFDDIFAPQPAPAPVRPAAPLDPFAAPAHVATAPTPQPQPPRPAFNIFDSPQQQPVQPPAEQRQPPLPLFGSPAPPAPAPQPAGGMSLVHDLFGSPSPPTHHNSNGNGNGTNFGVQPSAGTGGLGGLFDAAPTARPTPAPAPSAMPVIDGPFVAAPAAVPSPVTFEAFRCEDFAVEVTVRPAGPSTDPFSVCNLEARLQSLLATPITGVSFLAAVPRTAVLEMKPLPVNEAAPRGSLQQQLSVDNKAAGAKPPLMLRFRVMYQVSGADKMQQFQVAREW